MASHTSATDEGRDRVHLFVLAAAVALIGVVLQIADAAVVRAAREARPAPRLPAGQAPGSEAGARDVSAPVAATAVVAALASAQGVGELSPEDGDEPEPEDGVPIETPGVNEPSEAPPETEEPQYFIVRRLGDALYVPLRDAIKFLQGTVGWDEADQKAYTISGIGLAEFWAGSRNALLNERELELKRPPQLVHGVFHVSLVDFAAVYEAPLSFGDDGKPWLAIRGRGLPVREQAELYEVEIDRTRRRLRLRYLDREVRDYPVCVGRGSNTPLGRFRIANKARYPSWRHLDTGRLVPPGPSNPLGPRWMGTTAVGDQGHVIGIHGTNRPSSIGRAVSRGCIRMHNKDAIELYDLIQVGTPVWIHK